MVSNSRQQSEGNHQNKKRRERSLGESCDCLEILEWASDGEQHFEGDAVRIF
jgi:hypothetical protein